MNCEFVVEQIVLQSGRPALSPEVERHLAACVSCAKVYQEQQALWRRMDVWDTPEVTPGFDRRLFDRIDPIAKTSWAGLDWLFRLLRPLQPAFPLALACMLLIATAVVDQGRWTAPAAPDATAASIEDVRQIERALDDLQMLSDFEILPVEQEEGKS